MSQVKDKSQKIILILKIKWYSEFFLSMTEENEIVTEAEKNSSTR